MHNITQPCIDKVKNLTEQDRSTVFKESTKCSNMVLGSTL